MVYLLQNPHTLKTYVGRTERGSRRIAEHFSALKHGRHINRKLQRAYDEDPRFEVATVHVSTRAEAINLEQSIIDRYWGSPLFLNLSADAEAGAYEFSEETRAKISAALRTRVVGPETRARMSLARTGQVMSEATREKCRNKEITPEFRLKMGEVMKGNAHRLGSPMTEKTREALLTANSKPVIAAGVLYDSHDLAAKAYGVTKSTVTNRVRSNNPFFADWKYPDR
jgi:group I intron endonuclease